MTDKQLPGNYTVEKLKAMEPEKLYTLWKNAKASSVPGAKDLADAIADLGTLSFMEGGMPLDSPAAIQMHEIINSEAGVAACISATDRGEPALAGVDKQIKTALGDEYCAINQGTHTAGHFVGEMMRSKGYAISKRAAMPDGCEAKGAAVWIKRLPLERKRQPYD